MANSTDRQSKMSKAKAASNIMHIIDGCSLFKPMKLEKH